MYKTKQIKESQTNDPNQPFTKEAKKTYQTSLLTNIPIENLLSNFTKSLIKRNENKGIQVSDKRKNRIRNIQTN